MRLAAPTAELRSHVRVPGLTALTPISRDRRSGNFTQNMCAVPAIRLAILCAEAVMLTPRIFPRHDMPGGFLDKGGDDGG